MVPVAEGLELMEPPGEAVPLAVAVAGAEVEGVAPGLGVLEGVAAKASTRLMVMHGADEEPSVPAQPVTLPVEMIGTLPEVRKEPIVRHMRT